MKCLLLTIGLACVQVAAPQASTLTRQEAEQLALKNNPRVKVSSLLAEVQAQVVRETRADQLPNVTGNLTVVDANQGSRISAGTLTSPRLVQHAGGGIEASQLITDFGRTRSLVASQRLREKARIADIEATREDIILAADQVFYQQLEAQASLQVANETVAARQSLVDQISALTKAKLKSDLDLNFAAVNLSQAKLLQLSARSNVESARSALGAVLGFDHAVDYQLIDNPGELPQLPPDPDSAIADALNNRPDLRSLDFSQKAAQTFSVAQSRQVLPTISALAVAGATPWGSTLYYGDNWYAAAGVNVTLPIFNGFRFRAQAAQASLEANAQAERLHDLHNRVARDVRTAWLTAQTERQRVDVTNELLNQANTALSLARTRYDLGLSSIVELSQAQLQQTQAAIDNANARSSFGMAYASFLFQTGRDALMSWAYLFDSANSEPTKPQEFQA